MCPTVEIVDLTKKEVIEKDKEIVAEYFFDGWTNPANLKYLPEADVGAYEKYFDWDCFKMCIDTFQLMEEYDLNTHWMHNILYQVVPVEDKRIDYFLSNNNGYALIMNACHVSIKQHLAEQMDYHNSKIAEIRLKQFTSILSEMDNPDAIARIGVKEIDPFIKVLPSNKGRNPLIVQRNIDIRKEYYEMEKRGCVPKYIRKELAEKHNIEKPQYIKDIISKKHL